MGMSQILQSNIKKHLQLKNLTAAELERRTGIPHAVVNILHGRSKNPSLKTVHAIAQELGCSVEDLLSTQIKAAVTGEAVVTEADQTSWDASLYLATVQLVLKHVENLVERPSLPRVTAWVNEAYSYGLGSPERKADERFIHWMIEREYMPV